MKGVKCVSDRDDIDLIEGSGKASESKEHLSEHINSSNNKFNQAIRQNPLTHSDEKPAGRNIFGKIKFALSQNVGADSSAEEVSSGILDALVNKKKKN